MPAPPSEVVIAAADVDGVLSELSAVELLIAVASLAASAWWSYLDRRELVAGAIWAGIAVGWFSLSARKRRRKSLLAAGALAEATPPGSAEANVGEDDGEFEEDYEDDGVGNFESEDPSLTASAQVRGSNELSSTP